MAEIKDVQCMCDEMSHILTINELIDFLNEHKTEIPSIYFGDDIEVHPCVSNSSDPNRKSTNILLKTLIKAPLIIYIKGEV